MPPAAYRIISEMDCVARVGVTDRNVGGDIVGYVLVTTDGVVAWFRWRSSSREWALVNTASVEEVSGE